MNECSLRREAAALTRITDTSRACANLGTGGDPGLTVSHIREHMQKWKDAGKRHHTEHRHNTQGVDNLDK